MDDIDAFIRANTAPTRMPLLPELVLHLATEVTPLWQATEETLRKTGLPPPYWAFAWVGGQAVARYLLDHPESVAGKRVFDFASGSGIVALAAARTGAAAVTAAEIDPIAVAAIRLNAAANGCAVEADSGDRIGDPLDGIDIVCAGDVCYEKPMSDRVMPWLRALAGAGKTVLLGDPGRAYRPQDGLKEIARHQVPTSVEIEDRAVREAVVWRVLPG